MLEEQIIKNSNELIKENYGSIVLCSKIDGRIDEDLFNENLSKMYEVKGKFNQDKSKFNTFLTKCLYNNRTNYLRDNLNEEEIPVKKEQLNRFQDSLNIAANVEKDELIDKITSTYMSYDLLIEKHLNIEFMITIHLEKLEKF